MALVGRRVVQSGRATAPRRRRCCRCPETSCWSSSARLIPVRLRRIRATRLGQVELGVERVAADVGDLGGQFGAARGEGEAAEHPLVDEPELGVRRRRSRTAPGCWAAGARRVGSSRNWPLIPRWASTASPSVSGSQRYLPRRRGYGEGPAGQAASRSPSAPGRWRRTGRGCSTSTADDLPAADRGVEAAPDDLDLGKLRHACRAGRPRDASVRPAAPRTRWPRRSARLPSCCGRRPDRSRAGRS